MQMKGWIQMKKAEKDIKSKKWYDKTWNEIESITWKEVLSFQESWLYLCILCLAITIAALMIFIFVLNARIDALLELCRESGIIYVILGVS